MKSGLEYFPLDCNMDDKLELIEAEFGITGFGVVVKLFQKIYGGQGYYIEWTNEVALLFSRRVGLGGSVVSEIVSASINRGIFSKKHYDKYQILTSKGIQKRYLEAVIRRKNVVMKNEYLLIDVTLNYQNVSILRENVNINDENVDIFKQSKVKESKVKESKKTYSDYTSNENLKSALNDFEEMRKTIKKPLADRSRKMLLDKLDKLTNDDDLKIAILNQSIFHNWQGVFELKEGNNGTNSKPNEFTGYCSDGLL